MRREGPVGAGAPVAVRVCDAVAVAIDDSGAPLHPCRCTSRTLAGESVFIPADTGNSAYREDGAHLRVTRFEGDFPGGTFAMDFGAKQGDITCGGSVTTSQGTYT